MTRVEPAAKVTRGRLLWAGAAAATAAAVGSRGGVDPLAAAPNPSQAEILGFFLTLEQVQEAFYRAAVESGTLDGELLELARTVGDQEHEHVAFLTKRLGARAESPPRTDFGDAFSSPERFRAEAVELEEAAIAGYIGQAGHLRRRSVSAIATLLSVEARQVAWLRDLEGVNPAPRAADPAREAGKVLDALREKGFLT